MSETQTVTVAITDDSDAELSETFTVSLGTRPGTMVPVDTTSTATVTILDDEPPAVILGDETVGEGDGTVTVTATLSRDVGESFTVDVSTTAGTGVGEATAGEDYTALSDHTLTFVGTMSETQTVTVAITEDSVVEPDETFSVSLGTPSSTTTAVTTSDTATVTIIDATVPLTLSLDPMSVFKNSGTATVSVTASVPSAPATATEVAVMVAGGGANPAVAGEDFTPVSALTITIPANAASATGSFVLTLADGEEEEEDAKTLIVSGTASGFAVAPTTLTITEATVPLTLSLNPASVSRSRGTATVSVTASVPADGAPTRATAIAVTVEGDTAVAGEDFTAVDDFTITISANETSATGAFVLTLVDGDGQADGDEREDAKTLTVSGTARGFVVAPATLTITEGGAEAIEAILPELAQVSVASVVGAVSDRIGQVASGSFVPNAPGAAGLLANALAAQQQGLNDGTVSLQEALAGSSLGAGQAGPDMPVGVWISADYVNFSGEAADLGLWDGRQRSLHAGVDRHLSATALVGIAVSWFRGDFTFNEDSSLDTDTRLVGVSPYFGWHTPDGSQTGWATISLGRGDLEQKGPGLKTDLKITSLAVGGSHRITEGAGTHVNLKGDLFTARVSTDASGSIPALRARAHRFRLAMEAEASGPVEAGGQISYSAAIGLRRDAGAGDTGYGLEVDGTTGWTDPDRGLRVSGHGNLLLLHSGDLGEWGIGGQVRFTPKHGRGPGFRLRPVYGTAENNPGQIWDREIAELDPAGEPEARLSLDTSWGRAALSGRGLLTPYGGLELSEGGSRIYRLGTRVGIGPALSIDLAGERTKDGGRPEHGIGLQIGMRW